MSTTYVIVIIGLVALALLVWLLVGGRADKPALPKEEKPGAALDAPAPKVAAPAPEPAPAPVPIAQPAVPEAVAVPVPEPVSAPAPAPKKASKPKAAPAPKPVAPKAAPAPKAKTKAAPKAPAPKPVAKAPAAKPKAEQKPKVAAKPKAAPKAAPKVTAKAAPAPVPAAPPPMTAIGVPGASGAPDNLLLVKGLGPKLNTLLTGLGITRFDQIAAWSADDAAKVDEHLGAFKGRIARDNWIEQAGLLATGKIPEFEAKFGKLDSENR